jgi:hypothetical protein
MVNQFKVDRVSTNSYGDWNYETIWVFNFEVLCAYQKKNPFKTWNYPNCILRDTIHLNFDDVEHTKIR